MIIRAVDSVLAQDYPNVELIVVDDGSTDRTASLLDAHPARECFMVRSVPRPAGAPAARNLALDIASGQYITGMDDDDTMTSTRLSELMHCYQQGAWSCVASTYQDIYGTKAIIRRLDTGVIDYNAIRHYNKIGNQVLTSTERLRAIGGFDPSLPAFQDYDTWIRLLERFGPAFKLRDPSYVSYVTHSANRISDDHGKVRRGFALFLKKNRYRFTKAHRQSMLLLSRKVTRTPLTLREFAANVNIGNYKLALPLLINSNPSLKPIKRMLKLRFRNLT